MIEYCHYEIYVNEKFVKDVYCFQHVLDYLDKYFLYGKISYRKI